MELFTVSEPIRCHTKKAASFPGGVLTAHQRLHQLFPFSTARRFFGISRPEGPGLIAYWAAVEKLGSDEDPEPEIGEFVIPAGEYIGKDIPNFKSDIAAIGRTFQQLLMEKDIDPNGFCLEWYFNMDDVRCMIPLLDKP